MQRAGSIFVSETFVRDVFGGQDPVGQKLSLDKQHELTVRGVYQDTPENTAYHFDFVAPIYAGGGYIDAVSHNRYHPTACRERHSVSLCTMLL